VNSIDAFRAAQEKRKQLQDESRAIGINEEYIDLLVDEFYAKVMVHPELGPVFNARICDWTPHLAKMKLFWGSIMLRTSLYEGKPMQTHPALRDLARPELFAVWLALFEEVVRETAPNDEVVDKFMERAKQMGTRIRDAMYPVS
jgi:hemoglobin